MFLGNFGGMCSHFITSSFKRTGKTISEEIARQIARQMENHPYFVQQLAHTVWNNRTKNLHR